MARNKSRDPQNKSVQRVTAERSERPKKDYWDAIADDVASGYGARRDRNIFNIDQRPDDNRRGDEEPPPGRP